MSFKYKVGDLIEAAKSGEINVFGHGCNCFCTMGSGIAPLIKESSTPVCQQMFPIRFTAI